MVCEASIRHLNMTIVIQTHWTRRHGNKWWMPVEVMAPEETMAWETTAWGTMTWEMTAQETTADKTTA
jgi:hypothetical protein